ncbi:MAG: hypothetical protein HOV80_10855 [Polyangiaceae bacterium]|nr:hypothetical protein [Polyangiaceae bacterium]
MIEISIDGRMTSHPLLLAPGAKISGAFVVDHDPQGVEVSLVWYTEGKGTEHLEVHWLREYLGDELERVDTKRRGRFEASIPTAPLSYEGTLIRICWVLRVRAFARGGGDESTDLSLSVGAVAPSDQWVPR